MKRNRPARLALELLHRPRIRVTQPGNHLKQREINVRRRPPRQVRVAFFLILKNFLEVLDKFRQTFAGKISRTPSRLALLIAVIETGSYRMMRIVYFA